MKVSENIGEISICDDVVVWTIPNFFSFPLCVDSVISSPLFHIGDEIWALEVWPNGQKLFNSEGWCGVILWNQTSECPHGVHVEIGIKDKDGRILKSCWGVRNLTTHRQIAALNLFRTVIFQTDKRAKFVPDGYLTVFCKIYRGVDEFTLKATPRGDEGRAIGAEGNTTATLEVSESGEGDEIRTRETKSNATTTVEVVESNEGFTVLSQNLEDLYLRSQFCDFTVKVKDREFLVHKAILGARSSVFASMLQHDMREKNTGVVEIADCDPETFDHFLFYLYSGNVKRISQDNAVGLYEAAEKYDVPVLKAACVGFLKDAISVESVCDVMALAVRHGEKELIKQATDYFLSNTQEILLTVKWQTFMKQYSVAANELYIKAFSNVLSKS